MSEAYGGPAFPTDQERNGLLDRHQGMTLRDYFAAHVLPATLSASASHTGSYDYVAAAVGAYQLADAMLDEREKF